MAELQTFPKPRVPTANLPLSMRNEAAAMLQPKPVEIPSYEDIISGKTNVIGKLEIPQATIDLAVGGDQKAEKFIRSRIDVANLPSTQETQPIAGVKRTATGELETDLPETLTDSQRDVMGDYVENRKAFFSFLDSKVVDPRVRDLLIDHYSTGEFFRETGRQLREQARFTANIPNYIQVLLQYGIPAIVESTPSMFGFEVPSFSEAWAKRQPAVAGAFASYRNLLDEAGVSATYEGSINDFIKEKFIERYGQDVYERDYQPELEGLGKIESPIIPSGMGQELLDFGFNELAPTEQGISFLLQNAPVTTGFGILHLQKGKSQLAKVARESKKNPKYANMDPVTALREIEIAEKSNMFTREWRKATARIGATFNNRGAIGSVEANESARSALFNLDKRIAEKAKDLRAERVPNKIKVIQGELDALQSRRNRIMFGGAKNPYMFNLLVDESIIAIGQTAGYNLFPQIGLDEGTGEVLGALSFAFAGRPIIKKTVAAPFKVANFFTGGNAGVIGMNMVEMIENLPMLPKGLLVNRSLAELEATLGRPLAREEVQSFKMLDKIMKGMPNEQREAVFRSIENYNELRDRIVSRFDEGEMRDEAEQIFRLSFGHISGLAPLQALEFSSLKNVSGESIKDAVSFQLQSEASLDIAQAGITRLREMIAQKSGVDTEDTKFLAGWVNNFQAAADQERMNIVKRKTEYLGLLREYKTNVLSDPSVDIDKDVVNNLAELEIALVPGARENIEQQREIIMQTATDVSKRINDRARIISDMRGTPEYRKELGRLQEDIYDAHMSTIYALARNAYAEADKAIGDRDIDISGAVLSFVTKQKDMDATQLRGLFSAGSEFFSSRSGKMAQNAFNDMAQRSLVKNMGLDQDDLSELVEFVTAKNLADGTANPDYLGDQVSFIDIALHFSQKEGSQFSPFSAKPFEVEEVRRHFQKMGMSKADDASAKPFNDAASDMENSLKAIPEVWEAVQTARDTYRDLIFDPTRSGSKGNQIVGAATGPEFVTKLPGGYKRPYRLGMEPENWHEDLGIAIKDAIEGKAKSADNVKVLMDDLTRFWGDRDETGNIVFDVTTEKGRAKLENVANLVKANLYEYWAEAKEAGLSEAVRQNVLGGDLPKGTYNFMAARNLSERVAPAITIMVKDGDGPAKPKLLFDLDDMIAAEQDITQILSVSQSARKQYGEFIDEVNGKVGDMGQIAQEAVGLQKRTVNQLEELAQMKDPKKFYETYILNNDITLVRNLKANFVKAMTDGGMSEEEAIREFGQGMTYMMTNGLIARAGVAPNQQITFKALDGQKRTVETMTEAATIVSDLDNPNVTAILEEFMDDDHIAFMQDIGEYMLYASGASAVAFKPKGQIRGISPNELISRAFNIARGMVSPTYVAAEFAVRLMSQSNVNALSLAATDKEAARIMQKVLNTPGEVTQEELKTFGTIAKAFVAREIAKTGDLAPAFVPQEELYAATMEMEMKQAEEYKVSP